MAESKPGSVADLKSRFEGKSPTSTGSAGKVAELKAKLEKSPSSVAVASTTSPTNATAAARPAVVRSNSANKLSIASTSPSTEEAKAIVRSASAGKLTGAAALPEAPKTSPTNAAPKALPAAKPAEKRPLEETPPKAEIKPVQPAAKVPASVEKVEEQPKPQDPMPAAAEAPVPEASKVLTLSIDSNVPEVTKSQSPTSLAAARLRFATDLSIPPTVEEQDYYVLWGLSFIVPFFLLRFVFELVRRFVLYPARMAVRFAPGGNKLLSWLYVKAGPIAVQAAAYAKERLPPMDAVNAAAKAGLEKFLATLQTTGGAAYPHLLHLAESIKALKFREAATETLAVLKAWAPMLLLLIPLTKNAIVAGRQGWLMFWRVSKTAFYLPFGRFLRGAVQNLGRTLSENPDVFAERVAGLLGPIVGFFVSSIVIVGVGLTLGLVDYSTLSSMYIAWFFKLLGLVSEPSLLDQANLAVANELVVDAAAQAAAAAAASATEAGAAAAIGEAATGGGGGWSW